jgi:ribosomal protein S12 methylthiotransferase
MKVCLISLGCPKNLIDSEVMAGTITAEKMEIVYDPADADVAVVNTCGFVRDAVEESLGVITDLCNLRKAGVLKGVVVAGCLVERFRERLLPEIPDADALLTISDYSRLGRAIEEAASGGGVAVRPGGAEGAAPSGSLKPASYGGRPRAAATDLSRVLLTPSHTAYLRIAEGCNHRCSFCAIPSIRGRLRSRPIPILTREARQLARLGVKEINLVAEDTTDYGRDLQDDSDLPALLDALSGVRGIRWIRILYAFPSRVTDSLIRTMQENRKVLAYLDVPVQHYSGSILRSMRRGTTPAALDKLIARLREGVPGIVIRTSVIVGYPGERAAQFDELFDFVRRVRFERLGAFAFSPEPGTAACNLKPRPAAPVVERRIARLMEFQRSVIEERNISLVGGETDVIVDTVEKNSARGRTFADAPDIDCGVTIRGKGIKAGKIVRVRFTGHEGYDLVAEPVVHGS